MITTFQALAVTVLAVLPGALYVFGVERQTGRWGVTLSDRLLRFTAASALLQALLAPATYQAYRTLVHTGRLSQGRPLAWWTWLVVLGYLAVPAVAGDRVGRATRQRKPWAQLLTGPSPAPRAWDHLFARQERRREAAAARNCPGRLRRERRGSRDADPTGTAALDDGLGCLRVTVRGPRTHGLPSP